MTTSATIPFTFEAKDHAYRDAEGNQLPSVTQILREAGLAPNFDHVDAEVLARKALLGKLVHQACHFFDENDLDESGLPDEVLARFEGYKKFRAETGYKPEVNEFQQIGVINGMRFGMQFDSIGKIPDGRRWIVDIKNAATWHRSWGVQLAAYEQAAPAKLGQGCPRTRIAVQLFADGRYKLHTFSDPSDYQVFQSALAISVWKRNNKLV